MTAPPQPSDVLKHWILILAPSVSILAFLVGFVVWFVTNDVNKKRDIDNLNENVKRVLANQERSWTRVQTIDSVVYRVVVPYIEAEKEQRQERLYGHASIVP